MRTAKETRTLAWQTLSANDCYGNYLLGQLLLSAVALLAIVPMFLLLMGFAMALALGAPDASAEKPADPAAIVESLDSPLAEVAKKPPDPAVLVERLRALPPAAVAGVFAVSALVAIALFYLYGFVTWSKCAMAIAAVRRGLRPTHALSGWGNGWRMAKLLVWRDTLVFLYFLLLIVPGVIASFSYAMAPLLQVDHPDWSPRRCLDESKRLMEGNRIRLFTLGISFIGWYLLAALASQLVPFVGGFASFFLEPYPATAGGLFYEELLDANAVPEPEGAGGRDDDVVEEEKERNQV